MLFLDFDLRGESIKLFGWINGQSRQRLQNMTRMSPWLSDARWRPMDKNIEVLTRSLRARHRRYFRRDMAKKRRASRKAKQPQRETNWLLIGGVVAAVIIVGGLFYLLYTTIQEPSTPQRVQSLIEYCEENPDNCITKGSPDAPVTIVEVSDYGCGHCRDFNLTTAPLLEDLYVRSGQVQWVALPYALGDNTAPAAEAAMCAADQDVFFEFHTRMFEIQSESQALTADGFRQAAEELDLDMDAFNACFGDGKYGRVVQDNVAAARRTGVDVTPTFFVNGTLLRGNQPLATFQQAISGELSAIQ
jgi:protein-disulfide isomerase